MNRAKITTRFTCCPGFSLVRDMAPPVMDPSVVFCHLPKIGWVNEVDRRRQGIRAGRGSPPTTAVKQSSTNDRMYHHDVSRDKMDLEPPKMISSPTRRGKRGKFIQGNSLIWWLLVFLRWAVVIGCVCFVTHAFLMSCEYIP